MATTKLAGVRALDALKLTIATIDAVKHDPKNGQFTGGSGGSGGSGIPARPSGKRGDPIEPDNPAYAGMPHGGTVGHIAARAASTKGKEQAAWKVAQEASKAYVKSPTKENLHAMIEAMPGQSDFKRKRKTS